MTDADTIREADGLWKLVSMVQEAISKDGKADQRKLAAIRRLADEILQEGGAGAD